MILAGSALSERYADNFGQHEWSINLLRKAVEVRSIQGGGSFVLQKNGFGHASKQGNLPSPKVKLIGIGIGFDKINVDWKLYKFIENGKFVGKS